MVEKWTTLLQNWSTLPCIHPICIDTWQFERPHIDDTWMKVLMDELTIDKNVNKGWHHIMPCRNQRWNVRMISGIYLAICKDGHFDQLLDWQLVKINNQIGQRAIGQKDTNRKSRVQNGTLVKLNMVTIGDFLTNFPSQKVAFSCSESKNKTYWWYLCHSFHHWP